VDYDQGGDNHGWKLTLSQNIAIGMGPEFRPMLRFYVTGGQVDNEHTAKVNGTQDQQLDSLNVGGCLRRGSDAIALSKERSRLALRLAGLRLRRPAGYHP
jgi:hypothetical protein